MDEEVQGAINGVRADMQAIRDRLKEVELKGKFYKEGVDEMKQDLKDMKASLHLLTAALARNEGGMTAGKWFADKAPWVVAIAAFFMSAANMFKGDGS